MNYKINNQHGIEWPFDNNGEFKWRNIHISYTYSIDMNATQFWINGKLAFTTNFDYPLYDLRPNLIWKNESEKIIW